MAQRAVTLSSENLLFNKPLRVSQVTALKVWGWICTGTSLLLLPLVFGIIGIILGYLVRSRGDKEQGTIIMIASIGTMILGIWIGALIGATTWG